MISQRRTFAPQLIRLEKGQTAAGIAARLGFGNVIGHHGELLQGVFEGQKGQLQRGLITLPLASMGASATFWPRADAGVRIRPGDRSKARRAAEATLSRLGLHNLGGDITVDTDIPVGHGYGSSTADVLATILATASAMGVRLSRSTVYEIAIAAEGACDSILYGDHAVLFAQREGTVIEDFGADFPPLIVVGFRARSDPPVDTLRMPRARYTSLEIETFRILRALARYAVERQDPRSIGRVATASARINQRYRPKPWLDVVVQLAEDHGACGIQVAHSGSIVGALFDAADHRADARAADLSLQARKAGFVGITTFALNVDGAFV